MNSVRVSAMRVYLQHTLSSALLIVARLQQGWEKADPRTMKAAELWVETIRNAHNVCGVFGLVAVDRAEEYLLQCIKLEVYQGKVTVNISEHHFELCHGAAKFYSRALSQQKTGVGELVELWEYAGYCADRVWTMRQVVIDQNVLFCIDNPVPAGAPDSLTSAEECHKKAKISEKNGQMECARLWTLVSKHHQSAAVFTSIGNLHATFSTLLGGFNTGEGGGGGGWGGESGSGTKFRRDLQRRVSAAKISVGHLTKAVDCATKAAEAALKGSTPLQALWQRAASQLEHAASSVVHAALEHFGAGDHITSRVSRLIVLADNLTPLVYQYEEHRAVPRSSAGTAWLQETGQQLAGVFKQISESFFSNIPGEVEEHMSMTMEELRLAALIKKVEDCLKLGPSALSREQMAIEHYSAQARAVDPTRSPAHAHIEECWLEAAVQMRSVEEEAVAASASSAFAGVATALNGVPLAVPKSLEECAKQLVRLAVGIFADAAADYAKAECATSAQAQQLWTEAADHLVKVGVIEKGSALLFLSGQPSNPTSGVVGSVLGRCAQRCAEAAACCEKMGDEATSTFAGTTTSTATAFTSFQSRELQLRLAAVELDREMILHRPLPTVDRGGIGDLIPSIRQMFSSAIALVLEQTSTLRAFPPGHSMHQETPEKRADQAVWMCDTVLDLASFACTLLLPEKSTSAAVMCLKKALICCDRVRSLVFGIPRIMGKEDRYNGYSSYGGGYSDSNDDNDTYEVSTPVTGCTSFQLACRRYLEAVRTRLDGDSMQSALWSKAAQYTTRKPRNHFNYAGNDSLYDFRMAVSDKLVRAAWKLRNLPGPPPAGVLTDLRNVGATDTALVNLVAEAEVQAEKLALKQQGMPTGKKFAPILALYKSAVLNYTSAARYAFVEVEGGAGTGQLNWMAQRAHTAARRFALAAKYLEAGRSGLSSWYKAAGECSSVSPPSQSGRNNNVPGEEEQDLADIAGDRYEATARALEAGNNVSFELWRKASEATGDLVIVAIAKVTKKVTIYLSNMHRNKNIDEANLLSAQAQAADDAVEAEQEKREAELEAQWQAVEAEAEEEQEGAEEAEMEADVEAEAEDDAEGEAQQDTGVGVEEDAATSNAAVEEEPTAAATLTGKRKFAP